MPYAARKSAAYDRSFVAAAVLVAKRARSSMYPWYRSVVGSVPSGAVLAIAYPRSPQLSRTVSSMFVKKQYAIGLRGHPCLQPLTVVTGSVRPWSVRTTAPVHVWSISTRRMSSVGYPCRRMASPRAARGVSSKAFWMSHVRICRGWPLLLASAIAATMPRGPRLCLLSVRRPALVRGGRVPQMLGYLCQL